MAWSLSRGFCEVLNSGGEVSDKTTPTLQVVDIRRQVQDAAGERDRYRMLVSDGDAVTVCLVGSSCEGHVKDHTVEPGSVLRLTDYISTETIRKRPVLVALEWLVLSPPLSMIGRPSHSFGAVTLAEGSAGLGAAGTPAALTGPAGPQTPNTKRRRVLQDEPTALSELTPDSGSCTVAARVTRKSDLRTWQNERGEGVLFWAELTDDGSCVVRTTFFRDAATRCHPRIVEGQTYRFCGMTAKPPSRPPPAHVRQDIELIADRSVAVTEAAGTSPDGTPGPAALSLQRLCSVGSGEGTLDCCAVVTGKGPLDEVPLRAGGTRKRLTVTLSDDTGDCGLTLWGPTAVSFAGSVGDVVLLRSARVTAFMGQPGLNLQASSSMVLGAAAEALAPDDSARVKCWWSTSGAQGQAAAQPPKPAKQYLFTLAEVLRDTEAMCRTGEERCALVTVLGLEGDHRYSACVTCKKSVRSGSDGFGWCEGCGAARGTRALWLLRACLSDHTGTVDAVLFDAAARALLQQDAAGLTPGQVYVATTGLLHRTVLLRIRARARGAAVSYEARPQPPGAPAHSQEARRDVFRLLSGELLRLGV
eukprot:TRINITY_DN10829_c0_g5_i1.p1 TRINITY_DN10829_c0_g5~~TRINITY_DN10829_c0_g5_i1.p1  ORF type:complete len:604 (+),score=138.10 TRINITY_DN10829_c0_g5_i1:54-1814(+)